MSGTSLGAKLSVVRALSTFVMALALAQPAGAQIFGAPARYGGASWWVGVDAGNTRAVNVSDGPSSANWGLEAAKPIRLAIDYRQRDRTIGVSVSQAIVPLTFSGSTCTACRGEVTVQQAMARYRIVAPLFGPGMTSVTELSVGATRWSALQGLDGSQLGVMAPNTDFTYGLSFGAALPLGDRLELTAMYDMSTLKHETQKSTASSAFSNASLKLATLRFGARLRLGT